MHFNCKTYSPDLIASIASEYSSGTAMHVLAKKHRIASKTLRRLFLDAGIACRGVKESIAVSPEREKTKHANRKLKPEDRDSFCWEYSAGDISVRDLAAKFGISVSTARKILKKQEGIFREPAYKSYKVNEEFFDVIDAPDKAYWFGFILADGCVFTGNSVGLRLSLQSSDRHHLETFRDALKASHPIKPIYKKYSVNGDIRSAMQYSVDIRNAVLVDGLIRHGCIPNKTGKDTYISGVPFSLLGHFVRGYFDGNGCISFSSRKNRPNRLGVAPIDVTWSCVGSVTIMSHIRSVLVDTLGIPMPNIYPVAGCWRLATGSMSAISSLYELFYKTGGPCLPRKKEKWEAGASSVAAFRVQY